MHTETEPRIIKLVHPSEPMSLATKTAILETAKDRDAGLAVLDGSDKQVAWISPVRRRKLDQAASWAGILRQIASNTRVAPESAERMADDAERAIAELRAESDVGYWIARIETHGKMILEERMLAMDENSVR